MQEKQLKAFIRAIEQLMGNPLEADAQEVDALYAEFSSGQDPAQSLYDLAAEAARKYRLQGLPVPAHIVEALKFTKRGITGCGLETLDPTSIIEMALNPIVGAVQHVSGAFRNRTRETANDRRLLEQLSDEVKRDWSEESEK
jgi:hypothetical protein